MSSALLFNQPRATSRGHRLESKRHNSRAVGGLNSLHMHVAYSVRTAIGFLLWSSTIPLRRSAPKVLDSASGSPDPDLGKRPWNGTLGLSPGSAKVDFFLFKLIGAFAPKLRSGQIQFRTRNKFKRIVQAILQAGRYPGS